MDTSKVTNMNGIFKDCSLLTIIPKIDTSKVTNMNGMFYGCSSLKSIPKMDTSKVTNTNNMFTGCNNLETLERPSDFIKYNFSKHPKILKKYPELRK
jgi:surface protein